VEEQIQERVSRERKTRNEENEYKEETEKA
jgi:hypothetical protein